MNTTLYEAYYVARCALIRIGLHEVGIVVGAGLEVGTIVVRVLKTIDRSYLLYVEETLLHELPAGLRIDLDIAKACK